jgi:hypothetical protein
MIQMDELSGRDHQDEFLVGQMITEERVSRSGPSGRQIEKLAVLVESHRMRGEPAESEREPSFVYEPTPYCLMLRVIFAPFIHVRMACLFNRRKVRARAVPERHRNGLMAALIELLS